MKQHFTKERLFNKYILSVYFFLFFFELFCSFNRTTFGVTVSLPFGIICLTLKLLACLCQVDRNVQYILKWVFGRAALYLTDEWVPLGFRKYIQLV